MITNTHSVGVVHDAVIAWAVEKMGAEAEDWWSLPVVAETWDGFLNDINGFHVKPEHAIRALNGAQSGPVAEGNVGGGTGMICYGFKGGIGTASRHTKIGDLPYTVGVLAQANFGRRNQLLIGGIPVGAEIPEFIPYASVDQQEEVSDSGSIIVVVATDAPLLPHQLKRLARRAGMGIARTGGTAMNGSGDIFIALSTANIESTQSGGLSRVSMLANDQMNPLFVATIEATEEAIINAMVAAESMKGVDDHFVMALPYERVQKILSRHNRLQSSAGVPAGKSYR
jgi:D-aminopeptidase